MPVTKTSTSDPSNPPNLSGGSGTGSGTGSDTGSTAVPVKTKQLPLRYLRYLPAIYQEMESLLPSYLYPFEERIDALRSLLAQIDNYVAPGLAPTLESQASADGTSTDILSTDVSLTDETSALASPAAGSDFLAWLAGWVALTLDEEWPETRRRRLISQAVELYRWRGTVQGMRRYLELYTGLPLARIEVHEARWPGGMQIGVSSRIGGYSTGAAPTAVAKIQRRAPVVERDYIVVTYATGTPTRSYIIYIAADAVARVDYNGDTVTIWRRGAAAPDTYTPAAVTRRNSLPEDVYQLTPLTGDSSTGATITGDTITYYGDTRCVVEDKRPYSFIVRLLLTPADLAALARPERLHKVKSIIEQEKPAHTICYLKLDQYRPQPALTPMQIGVQSTIGLDTYLR